MGLVRHPGGGVIKSDPQGSCSHPGEGLACLLRSIAKVDHWNILARVLLRLPPMSLNDHALVVDELHPLHDVSRQVPGLVLLVVRDEFPRVSVS